MPSVTATMTRVVALTAASLVGLTAASAAATTPTQHTRDGAAAALGASDCRDKGRALTYEEQFLSRPEAARFIEGGGFDDDVARFARQLCRVRTLDAAENVVTAHSRRLWDTAVGRVQGRVAVEAGELSAGDDRPLYWARLAMVAAVRQWSPGFDLTDADRGALIATLDRVSRGQDDITFAGSRSDTRVLVTGFDPFTLRRDVRQANPSGASALALDGVQVRTASGTVRLEAALFPVRWRDFGDGIVEQALLPHLTPGPNQVDAFATTSQGRVGRFDLERFNGAWRAGFNDNEDVCYRGVVPIPAGLPTVTPQPQWTLSTHPYAAMISAPTGVFPVRDNTQVTEVDPSTPDGPVSTSCPAPSSNGTVRTDGPTAGSKARAGGGGNYLSNEIAYRATLLRDAVGAQVPGGHIHTPVLQGLSASDLAELSNPTFESNRAAINAQVRALVEQVALSVQR